ncbi:MAG: hypothetical protein CMQ57_00810 [Gammaproteobacteria bacterium]|nr:hypothetical protein [Gammaproteobacteria bacterium]|tara:strand:- start:4165 stop:4374 length:210 start_codon:yes stop_codon:yes gene_type:complete
MSLEQPKLAQLYLNSEIIDAVRKMKLKMKENIVKDKFGVALYAKMYIPTGGLPSEIDDLLNLVQQLDTE